MKTKKCFTCEEELLESEFGSNGTYNGKPRLKPRCTKCNHIYEKRIFMDKMTKAIGGKANLKCNICGYHKCISALEFHHIDAGQKERAISKMQNYSYKRIKKEIDKCILLCCLCHREHHAGILDLPV